MKLILKKAFTGNILTSAEAEYVMEIILSGKASVEEISGFLGALHSRGEHVQELLGFLNALRKKAVRLPTESTDLMDTCGTGGDGAHTFNISTVCALVVASLGVKIAKHGNRSVSSKCGSADVLEALGVPTQLSPERAAESIDALGFAFLFAPKFHPALAVVAPVRKALGVRTVFNLLGPLANPARVTRQVIGVPDPSFMDKFAEVLKESGSIEAMIVSAEDGLDEFSISSNNRVVHLKNGQITRYNLCPEDFGLPRSSLEHLKGGEAPENAKIIELILGGEKGPRRDVVLMNSSAALVVAGIASSLKEGVRLAAHTIDSGQALGVLKELRRQQ